MYRIILFFSLITICIHAHASYLYRDFLTGFSDLSKYANHSSGCIIMENQTKNNIIETLNFDTNEKQFTYSIRIKCTDKKSNNKFLNKIKQHHYGIVWNYNDADNYEGMDIRSDNSNYYDDITNIRSLKIDFFKITDKKRAVYKSLKINQDGADDECYNTFTLNFNGKSTTIKAGHRVLKEIAEIENVKFNDSTRIGYFAGKNNTITVKRLQFTSTPIKESLYTTNYTKIKLDSIFCKSNDYLEGYWKYLDRKMDDKKMRLGGKYTIAIVRNKEMYQILYISGAAKMPDIWKPYTIKGTLKTTPFIDNYDLQWFDAQKEEIPDEGYATLSEGILSINLPINGTIVRFYKLQ